MFAARNSLRKGSDLSWSQEDGAWLLVPALSLQPSPSFSQACLPLVSVTPHCSDAHLIALAALP